MIQEFYTYEDMSELCSTYLFLIKDLDSKFFPAPWTDNMWHGALDSNHFIDILKVDNVVVGFALFNTNIVDSFAHLYKIVIDSSFRSKHLGRNLLLHSIEELRKRGVREYFLEVNDQNFSAIKLYETLGFKVLHTKKYFYSDGGNALIMKMNL